MEKDDGTTKLSNQQIKTGHLSLIKLLNCISHTKTIVNRDQNKFSRGLIFVDGKFRQISLRLTFMDFSENHEIRVKLVFLRYTEVIVIKKVQHLAK